MYLKIAEQIARTLGVPIQKLTLKAIQKSPIPTRFKKLLQGQTTGEASMVASALGSRATAAQELKAFAKTASALVGPGLAKAIFDSKKGNADPMNLAGPKKKPKTTNKSGNTSRGNDMKVPKKKVTYSGGQRKTNPSGANYNVKGADKVRPKLRPKK
tara:strand:+ start:41 stop:511 length:471 start_codon:yes stop_codon:yes gene_type:complete